MLKGHSNFKLSLIKESQGYYMRKFAYTPLDITRLKQQENKQIGIFYLIKYDNILNNLFEVPNIIESIYDNDSYGFTMTFHSGNNILDIIEYNDLFKINAIIDKLFLFLDFEIENSKLTSIPFNIIDDKLVSISRNIKDPILLDLIVKILTHYKYHKYLQVPVGLCHGDFTFSNMIFSDKIVLIDFLDSYIESPLQDIAKLLQEVNLKWTLLMADSVIDKIKVAIAYKYIKEIFNKKLQIFINKHNLDKQVIKLFYLITLLRIVPYTKDNKMLDILRNEIMFIWEELS